MLPTWTPDFLVTLDKFLKPDDQRSPSDNEILERVHKYFKSIQTPDDSIPLSPNERRKIYFMTDKLQHIARNSDRIRVIDEQVQELLDSSYNAEKMSLLLTYYSCFYLSDAKAKPIVKKKDDIINELLYAAYHEIACKMIENHLSYDHYFSNRVVMQLKSSKKSRRVQRTYDEIEKVAAMYHLHVEEIITFMVNCRNRRNSAQTCPRTDEICENWSVQCLYDYIGAQAKQRKAPTLRDFLNENNLCNLFLPKEIERYEELFQAYARKLVDQEIGSLFDEKNESKGTNASAVVVCKPSPDVEPCFPIDVFDRCKIMILWLDKHIGVDENCRDLKEKFKRLTSSFKAVDTVESFRESLSHVKDRKLFCIIQGSLSKDVVPEIEQMTTEPLMEPVVFIFCVFISDYSEWAGDFNCILNGGIDNIAENILNGLTRELNRYVKQKLAEDPFILLPDLVPIDYLEQYWRAFDDLMQQATLGSPSEAKSDKNQKSSMSAH